jgi:hypothetical protein
MQPRLKMQKVSIYILVILTHCLPAIGQFHFDSIKICHDANKALRQVVVKEYVANFQNGRLTSFHSKDGSVTYDDQDRKLTLKGLNNDNELDSISIQLTAKEFVFVNSGKTQTLEKSRRVSSDSFAIGLPFISFKMNYQHDGGYIEKLWFTVGNKTAIIAPHHDSKGYFWNIAIETDSNKNVLCLAQFGSGNHFFQLHDNSNKVGVILWSDKENGIFNRLIGKKIVWEDNFASDYNYQLLYSKKGILRRNKWRQPLVCD